MEKKVKESWLPTLKEDENTQKVKRKSFLIGQHKTKCFPVKAIALSNPLAES